MDAIFGPLSILVEFLLNAGISLAPLQQRHVINLFKAGTSVYTVFLMNYYSNFTPGSWLYLGLHGTYGCMWVLKDFTFPDKSFQRVATLGTFIITVLVSIIYWIPAFLLVSGQGVQYPSPQRIAVCIFLNSFGTGIVLAADAQKYFTLKYKQGLIDDGMFKYTRSPNFLGEIMIYLSFGVCTGILEVYLLLTAMWVGVLGHNIWLKEKSNSKKKGWQAYERYSWSLFPKVIPSSSVLSLLVYLFVASIVYSYYNLS